MWFQYVGAMLTKAALPIIGAALALIVTLSVALWWTNGRLSDARDALAGSRADTLQAVRANQSNLETINELRQAAAQNAEQRDEALRRQAEAVARIRELENREPVTEVVERVIRAGQSDDCAVSPIPLGLRNSASGNGN